MTVTRGAVARDRTAPWRHVDWLLVGATTGIGVIGVVMVFSVTRGTESDTQFVVRQTVFLVFGTGLMIAVALVDYRRLVQWAWIGYAVTVALLVAVISPLGHRSKGAQAWFGLGPFQLQPAEFAKVALVVIVAAELARLGRDASLSKVGLVLGLTAVPAVLVLVQPDLGMALVYLVLVLTLVAMAGIRGRILVVLLVIGAILTVAVLNSTLLHQYQKDRLTAFVDPSHDTQGVGYNVTQAQIAIETGSITGKGLFAGPLTQDHYVPEQHTDFIFTAVGEELGFFGAAGLLVLFFIVVLRILRAARLAADRFGMLLCCGALAVLGFQIFENAGMAMGIMPVTGLPLPLVSYGGSSALTSFLLIGLVLNVAMHRFR